MSKILELVNAGKVFEIERRMLKDRLMTKEEMVAIFNHFDAFWQYDGEPHPNKPHALLKSGMHSNGFIACKNVLDYSLMCKLFAYEMFKNISLYKEDSGMPKINVVVASAYSALNLGYEVARILAKIYPEIKFTQVEKDKEGKPTIIRGGINPKYNVLVINELMTTPGGSTWETKETVLKCNGDKPAPNIVIPSFVLAHRSESHELKDGSKVIPVFHFDMTDWDVPNGEKCPLCEAGSEAIKPKDGNNWNIIHGRK